MRAKEVVVSDPEGKFIVGAIDVVAAVCVTVRCFIGTVQPFNHLFEWTVFLRNSIVVGKPNHLSDIDVYKRQGNYLCCHIKPFSACGLGANHGVG